MTTAEAPRGALLLVEDSNDDVLFFRRAVARTDPTVPVRVVANGVEAVQYLSGAGGFGDRKAHPLPSVVVLDLKLPRMSGLEVLEWMATQPPLRPVRTIVLTSSSHESDIRRATSLGAACYIVKPVDSAALQDVVGSILAFWSDPAASPALLARHAAPTAAIP